MRRLIFDSLLTVFFLALLALPISSLGLLNGVSTPSKKSSEVLSTQDVRVVPVYSNPFAESTQTTSSAKKR